ncbi:Enamine deaminase RidA, house cleaning of reactive enamine intermediates, YjgF/YER057c/UK114 family [Cryptosporangium aurantiacum]|uniref:Enamine deaminase RidA, house cleaning of reactive enamine intermediates, YjgF/YER057c/UK114 family n=2 Tax=Cryptosporangium aurantiacum TaxID=134849 RepID=A0A1M7NBM0_9ACTN|nr:Enamine deaminase RidA, house cleaning of reactive enamine intermediates, YjgF/YER057c/UK114 family [Cryptosporangium aurantiacum]
MPETGDVMRGVDLADRPRSSGDTGDRPRAARASVPVAGRAVVADPVRPEPVRPDPLRRPAPEPTGRPDFRRANPFEMPDPRGYSQAAVVTGQLVVLAGQTGVDPDGRVVDGGLVSQFDRAAQNLLGALAAAGGSPEDLVSLTVHVTSIDEYQANARAIGHVWRGRAGGTVPALSLAEVRRFWDPEASVQLAAQALVAAR